MDFPAWLWRKWIGREDSRRTASKKFEICIDFDHIFLTTHEKHMQWIFTLWSDCVQLLLSDLEPRDHASRKPFDLWRTDRQTDCCLQQWVAFVICFITTCGESGIRTWQPYKVQSEPQSTSNFQQGKRLTTWKIRLREWEIPLMTPVLAMG